MIGQLEYYLRVVHIFRVQEIELFSTSHSTGPHMKLSVPMSWLFYQYSPNIYLKDPDL